MNRHQRRAMKMSPAHARTVAAILAEQCFDQLPDGGQRHIDQLAALRALIRAFARSLADNRRPQLLQMTPEEGHAFPSCEEVHKGPQWSHWLAVGFDTASRGTFVTMALSPSTGVPVVHLRATAWASLKPRLIEAMESEWAPA